MPRPIPCPPTLPFVGNMLDITRTEEGDAGDALKPFERLADQYGPIFKLVLKGKERIVVAGYDLFEELCDETRFFKAAGPALESLNRDDSGKPPGLFTATSEKDSDWQQAHRILMPAFGPVKIREMFDEMHDIASQLVLKWARLGSEYRIPVADDFTRLTLDTIALCAMDYRFNSFYSDAMHPFVEAMTSTLAAGAARQRIPGFVQKFMVRQNEKIKTDSQFQFDIAAELVRHRRENPSDKNDLLNAMIHGKDPKTGEGMRDDLIAVNMITFLIAGHETTSGLLSFALYYMLKNPATYFRAQREVDDVIGKKKVTVDHLKDLSFINAILRETLRLAPTAPAFNRGVRPDSRENPVTLGNGEYELDRNLSVLCLIGRIQRDPKVWGDDANEFRPDRMMDGRFEQLPKAAWKPFGTGLRACIGRPFAWQEALLVMAMMLQNFDFRMDDPSWELKIKSNLTIKPDGFFARASLRKGITVANLQHTLTSSSDMTENSKGSEKTEPSAKVLTGKPMTILYGSNTGTCQSFAQKLAADARSHGYQATIKDLDAGVNALPTEQPVVIITSSYEGAPPDNAAHFVAWLESMSQGGSSQSLQNVEYAVFGCGHKDWSTTFQRIPKLVDASLQTHGATRLVDLNFSDAAQGNMFSDFDSWSDSKLWPAVESKFGVSESGGERSAGVDLEVSTKGRASQLQHDVHIGKVTKVGILTALNEPEKRFLEVELPEGMDFQAGDYLSVLPMNPDESVRRVLKRYSLPRDAVITIKSGGPVTLPENQPVAASELLKGFVEISQPATRKNIQACMQYTTNDLTLEILHALAGPLYQIEVVAKRISVLDLLETHAPIELPFGEFLSMLPPMRPRFYSISSSPLKDPTKCSITYGVINTTSLAGTGEFQGVAGNYLRSLRSGDAVQVSVRSAPPAFHLPASPHTTPIMLFCNGSGLAPFRGFIEERAIIMKSNLYEKLAPALLFIGCRSPEADALYHKEFAEWAATGAVDVRYAFSRDPAQSVGCRYVQDRMLKDKEDVVRMWDAGAKVYLCGSPGLVEGVGTTARNMVKEHVGEGADPEQIEAHFKSLKNERIAVDVFA